MAINWNYVDEILEPINFYKRAKKNKVRSCYSQKALMESWLYKQIEEWYENQPQKLTDKVRKAYLNIALGIR